MDNKSLAYVGMVAVSAVAVTMAIRHFAPNLAVPSWVPSIPLPFGDDDDDQGDDDNADTAETVDTDFGGFMGAR